MHGQQDNDNKPMMKHLLSRSLGNVVIVHSAVRKLNDTNKTVCFAAELVIRGFVEQYFLENSLYD